MIRADEEPELANCMGHDIVTTDGTTLLGALDATLAYINTTADDQNNGDAYNMVQAYLTLNF